MRDFCEKCFKDVDLDANGCCPHCGQNTAAQRAARRAAESEAESHSDWRDYIPSGKNLAWLAAIIIIAIAFFGTRHYIASQDRLYPGDQKLPSADGRSYTIFYGSNHPGKVQGLVFDIDRQKEYLAQKSAAPARHERVDPGARQILNNAQLGSIAAAHGNLAGVQELRRQQREARAIEKQADEEQAAELTHYGIGGAKIRLVRSDGLSFRTVADSVGRITIDIPPGSYTVNLAHPGYEPYHGGDIDVVFEQADSGLQVGNTVKPLYVARSFISLGLHKKLP